MLYVSLVVSAILLLVVNLIAWRAERPVGMIIAKTIAIGLASSGVCLVMLPPVLLQAILVCVAALLWGASHRKPRFFLALSCAATVFAFAIPGFFAYRQTKHLQEQFPYISMANRLPPAKKHRLTAALPKDAEHQLTDLENLIDQGNRKSLGDERAKLLREIHEETVKIFVNQQGFGVTRTNGLREMLLKKGIRRESPIPQPGMPSPSPWMSPSLQSRPASADGLRSFHQTSVADFINPAGFGFIKDRQHVAGFQEHQISEMPEPPRSWALQRLDLIGLLLQGKPIAYVSENLPRMQELKSAPTRELDEFESAGLLALKSGENLLVRMRGQERRMLGAIRAARQCLACHEAERGDLLGAFSYRMTVDESSSAIGRRESASP